MRKFNFDKFIPNLDLETRVEVAYDAVKRGDDFLLQNLFLYPGDRHYPPEKRNHQVKVIWKDSGEDEKTPDNRTGPESSENPEASEDITIKERNKRIREAAGRDDLESIRELLCIPEPVTTITFIWEERKN